MKRILAFIAGLLLALAAHAADLTPATLTWEGTISAGEAGSILRN